MFSEEHLSRPPSERIEDFEEGSRKPRGPKFPPSINKFIKNFKFMGTKTSSTTSVEDNDTEEEEEEEEEDEPMQMSEEDIFDIGIPSEYMSVGDRHPVMEDHGQILNYYEVRLIKMWQSDESLKFEKILGAVKTFTKALVLEGLGSFLYKWNSLAQLVLRASKVRGAFADTSMTESSISSDIRTCKSAIKVAGKDLRGLNERLESAHEERDNLKARLAAAEMKCLSLEREVKDMEENMKDKRKQLSNLKLFNSVVSHISAFKSSNIPSALTDAYEVPALTRAELTEKTGNFSSESLIGQGTCKVYYAILEDMGPIAIKRVDHRSMELSNDKFLSMVARVSRLKHDSLVQLLGYCLKGRDFFLAYEFATMGSLHDVLYGKKGLVGSQPTFVLDWMQRVQIAVDAARALEYLHATTIIHGELKSSKILLFDDFKAKIEYFEYSDQERMEDLLYDNAYYRGRRKHEFIHRRLTLTGVQTVKSDVYNFGVILLELLSGRKLWDDTKPIEQRSLVTWATPRLSEDRVKECVDPRLKGQYPPNGAAKLAAVAAMCVQYDSDVNMGIVVNALQSLLALKIPSPAAVPAVTPSSDPAV